MVAPTRRRNWRRDTQKTQHGIETFRDQFYSDFRYTVETLRKPSTGLKQSDKFNRIRAPIVETLRKPSTGLKLGLDFTRQTSNNRRDTQKTQHGIETRARSLPRRDSRRRDTQKTQHGIETDPRPRRSNRRIRSRHSENPARD